MVGAETMPVVTVVEPLELSLERFQRDYDCDRAGRSSLNQIGITDLSGIPPFSKPTLTR